MRKMENLDYTKAYQMAKEGNMEGYRFLYDSTSQMVYDFLMQSTYDQEISNGLITKVYDLAWARLGELADPNAFPGWVYGLAQNVVMQEKGEAFASVVETKMSADSAGGMGTGAGTTTGFGTGGMDAGPGAMHSISPNAAHMASPNLEHISSPNVQMTSPNVSHLSSGAQQAAAGGESAASHAAIGAKAGTGAKIATGAKAAAGTKAAFLSTAAGKVAVGIGCTIATAALVTGGYFVAQNLKKEEPTESTEISSATFETEEATDDNGTGTDEASSATEASTEEAASTTEATTEEAAALKDVPIYEFPEQQAWYAFMNTFLRCCDNYDCSTTYKREDALYYLTIGGQPPAYDPKTYEMMAYTEVFDQTPDPQGYKTEHPYLYYRSFDVEGTKWVACNILNIPEADYDKMSPGFERDGCYVDNGRYYVFFGGYDWESTVEELVSVQSDGEYYYVTYKSGPDPEYYNNDMEQAAAMMKTYKAKMKLIEYNGKKYWSIFTNQLAE